MRSPTPYDIASHVIANEGVEGDSFADDPSDSGGPTNWGITLTTLEKLGIDLDKDGDVDVDDLKQVDRSLAIDILVKYYYIEPELHRICDKHPFRGTRLRTAMMDWTVHSGQEIPIGELQQCLRIDVTQTVDDSLVNASNSADPIALANQLGAARRDWYFDLADRRAKDRQYCVTKNGKKGGWIRRTERFMDSAAHMTEQDFDNRVARWRAQ